MNIPMLKIGDLLIVTIHSDLNDQDATKFKDDLANEINKKSIKGVIIDISALDIVDSFIGRIICNIAGILKIMDAETAIVGIKPEVALTIVELGLEFKDIHAERNVEKGMEYLKKSISAKNSLETR